MKRITWLLPLALLMAFVSALHAQSLADLAKQEEERRKEVKDTRVITDKDVAKFKTTPQTQSTPETQPAGDTNTEKKDGADKPDADALKEDEPTDFEGRPESFWRKTMAEAHQRVKDLTNEANAIVLRIADLQNKFYAMDDGFKREDVQRDIQKSYYEQDLNKQNMEKAKAALQDLENEARKSGALPGWLGPGNP